jgi:GntR family transcriptional regulator
MSKTKKKETLHPYNRLQKSLEELINKTPAGNRLPSEPELAKMLGVSRATLREGMRTFDERGMVRRRQGVGTFVVPQVRVIESGLEVLESIERLANRIGLAVSMGELEITEILAGPEHAEKLQVEEETRLIKISRVIYADNRPVAYLIDIIPPEVISEQELQTSFTGSVLDFLQKRGTPGLLKSFTDIQAVAAESAIARKLQIQRGDTLLLFTARLYSVMGDIVDFSFSYFLPGYFRFHVIRNVDNSYGKK